MNQRKNRWICLAGLSVFLMLLSGCGGLTASLLEEARQFGEGKEEAAYYLEPPAYRLEELYAACSDPYRQVIWTEISAAEEEPDWEEMEVSDECISSRRELEAVLEAGLADAALGIELHFDRSRYLPAEGQLEEWLYACELEHPLWVLGLDEVRYLVKEDGLQQTVYLLLYYSLGQEEIRALRMQTQQEAETLIARWINGQETTGTEETDMTETDTEARAPQTEMEKAEAVWNWFTGSVSSDEEDQESSEGGESGKEGSDGSGRFGYPQTSRGYAMAAKLLLDGLDLENEIAAEPLEDGCRFQNRVRIDGEWWLMDCCFGAAANGNRDFFQKEE